MTDQSVDGFEIVDLPVLGVSYQVGQTLRDIADVNLVNSTLDNLMMPSPT